MPKFTYGIGVMDALEKEIQRMQLRDKKTKKALCLGQQVITAKNTVCILEGWRAPLKPSSEGHVFVRPIGSKMQQEFYAGVINAEFFPRNDRA